MTKGWSSPTPWGHSHVITPPNPRLLLLPLHRFPSPPPPPPKKAPALGVAFRSHAACNKDRRRLLSDASNSSVGGGCGTRRGLILFSFTFLGFPPSPPIGPIPPFLAAALLPAAAEAEEGGGGEHLELYTDEEEGFILLKPSSWLRVDKAGATALFVGKNENNNIGVVVNPVRLSSLRDFGTPQFVADKLIQAERRKESTKDAQVMRVGERVGHGGLPVYEFEYTVDSTRGGMKRIFSAAFVAAKKLYLLNIACSDKLENPLDSQTRTVLEQVLHSFDIAL